MTAIRHKLVNGQSDKKMSKIKIETRVCNMHQQLNASKQRLNVSYLGSGKKGKSNTIKLPTMEEKVTKIMDSGDTVDLVFLDFSKAFESVNHRFLIQKLKAYGIYDNIVNWIVVPTRKDIQCFNQWMYIPKQSGSERCPPKCLALSFS